ncbi:hypothetical protein CBL_05503 [Carabus blaptoides fortunei]
MSFRNGEAIVMRDSSEQLEGNTESRCSLKARLELYARKYYRQIFTVIFLSCAVIMFIILINQHTSKKLIPVPPEIKDAALEDPLQPRIP